ncbi:MAG TPA: 7-carboxy-7-deazaguanine synthase QueE [Gammaproteobacteria bacterium]|nr:7-carboxy-7-deazaguanine synthase QueE [Gammaproteobacteria bacterium]
MTARPEEAPREAGAPRLKITEIFFSIQGEASFSGWPTVFVRLTGCPLRCQYCDTAYAFTGGEWRSFDEISAEIRKHGTRYVCVTGGEPLAQPRCAALLAALCDDGFDVSLETSGAIDIADVDTRVSRVVDVKTPGSREEHRNRWENLALLTPRDALKFVICDRADYEWSKRVLADRVPHAPCPVFFSPSYTQLPARSLADWILEDRLPVRLQVQLHKVLWGDVPGR